MTKKIRVIFDADPLVRQKTGVGFYTQGLVTALAQIPELELTGFYFRPRGQNFSKPEVENVSFISRPWAVGMFAKGLRKVGLRLPWELLAWRRADIWLYPDFTTWPSLFKKPQVVTIHDLTFIDHPQYVQKRNLRYLRHYVKHDVKKAALVLTISKFSKRRIVEQFGIPKDKVLENPIPPAEPAKPEKPQWLPKNYILFISTIEPRKNVGGLIDAYLYLPDDLRQKYSLVICGGAGWESEEIIERIHHLRAQKENILTPGYVSDAERSALYKNAGIVTVPSFYEGFGMPVLEAFAHGAPVVASNLPVLKEIGSDAVLYFDPSSPESIKDTLEKVLTSAELRKKMIDKGNRELSKYSWRAVADDVYQAFRKLAG